MSLILLPAVDVVDGKAVRLVQGQAGSETEYGSAIDAALGWQRDGAEWIHLVDLDAAFGRGSNRELLAEVVGRLDVQVELSGGIRDDESLAAALATGCTRVNLGTAALENPKWCAKAIAEHGERVAVGLDVQIVDGKHRLRGRGWETDGGDLWPVLERLDAVVGTTVRPEVAVVYDWEVRWALMYTQGPRQQPGRGAFDKEYLQTCQDHYRPFWKLGVPVDLIESLSAFDR